MHPWNLARRAVQRYVAGRSGAAAPIEYGLSTYASGTFDSSGVAVATARVTDSSSWLVERMATSTSSSSQTTLTVYRGEVNAANVVDFTTRGNGDISETALNLLMGQFLTFRWTGGTTGATATIRIEGKRYLSDVRTV